MDRENFKSLLLVSLFALSIIMTGVLLKAKNPKIVLSDESKSVNYEIDIENIFYPQGFFISFGGGSYTGIYSEGERENLWKESKFILKNYLSVLDLAVIDYSEWREIEKTRSVYFKLPFSITLEQMYQILKIEKISSEIKNKKISTIIIPTSSNDKIYFGNIETEEYFKLKGKNKDETISKYMLELEKNDFTEYRRIDNIISFKAMDAENPYAYSNSELIPITKNKEIPVAKVTKEIDFSSEYMATELNSFLSRAFGNNMDFIKKIEGLDGSIAYIYGYNDKILRLRTDGVIEYSEKLSDFIETKEVDFGEGLNISLNYLSKYGSIPNSMYLANYSEENQNGEILKKYYFSYKIKNLNVFSKGMEMGYPVEVVLNGNKVVLLNKNIRKYVKAINIAEVWPNGPIYIDELIDKNFKIISSNYDFDYKIFEENREENWSMNTYIIDIMKNVKNIEILYFGDIKNNGEKLIPSWHFLIGNTSYYFDLYSGNLLYSYKIEDEESFFEEHKSDKVKTELKENNSKK